MFKNVLASLAAAGLLVAPIAAQANTRAADANVSLDVLAEIDRAPAAVGQYESGLEDDDDLWAWLLGFLAVGGGIILLVESSEDDRSSGTGG